MEAQHADSINRGTFHIDEGQSGLGRYVGYSTNVDGTMREDRRSTLFANLWAFNLLPVTGVSVAPQDMTKKLGDSSR